MTDDAVVSADQIIGVTCCPNCHKRFRVPKKHESLIGKAYRCSSCHETFVVQIDEPSQLEQAAINNAESDEKQKAKRARRTKGQIREEHLTRICENLKTLHKRLTEICDDQCSEEQVRVWCIDVLKQALGYDNRNIDTEVFALGQRIDIALKEDGKIFLVIECKNPRSKLAAAVRDQAVMYAVNKSADWAVATNGSVWKLWRVLPQKGRDPITVPVFDIALMDEDGVSESDVANFYLLTQRSLFNGETDSEFHRQYATNNERLLKAIQSDRVISMIGRVLSEEYLAHSSQKILLDEEFVSTRVADMLTPESL